MRFVGFRRGDPHQLKPAEENMITAMAITKPVMPLGKIPVLPQVGHRRRRAAVTAK